MQENLNFSKMIIINGEKILVKEKVLKKNIWIGQKTIKVDFTLPLFIISVLIYFHALYPKPIACSKLYAQYENDLPCVTCFIWS